MYFVYTKGFTPPDIWWPNQNKHQSELDPSLLIGQIIRLWFKLLLQKCLEECFHKNQKQKQKDRRVGNEFCDLSLNKRKADTL